VIDVDYALDVGNVSTARATSSGAPYRSMTTVFTASSRSGRKRRGPWRARDVARVMMNLAVEFSGQEHPVGRAVESVGRRIVADCTRLISAGRRSGAIPPGPRPRLLAAAVLGALDGLMVHLSGQTRFDVLLAERVVVGLLGLPPASASTRSS
jgi:hypothetical protein